jgi:hypothetical protein
VGWHDAAEHIHEVGADSTTAGKGGTRAGAAFPPLRHFQRCLAPLESASLFSAMAYGGVLHFDGLLPRGAGVRWHGQAARRGWRRSVASRRGFSHSRECENGRSGRSVGRRGSTGLGVDGGRGPAAAAMLGGRGRHGPGTPRWGAAQVISPIGAGGPPPPTIDRLGSARGPCGKDDRDPRDQRDVTAERQDPRPTRQCPSLGSFLSFGSLAHRLRCVRRSANEPPGAYPSAPRLRSPRPAQSRRDRQAPFGVA